MNIESLLDKVARILLWVLVHIIAPALLIGLYILLANVGDLGYFLLFATIIITLYHVLLAMRWIYGKMKKFQAPVINLDPLRAMITDHVATFHLGEMDWQDLKARLPDELTRRLEGLEAFEREIAKLNLPTEIAALARRLAGIEQKPAPAVVDLAPLEQRVAALETKPVQTVDLSGIEKRLGALEAKPVPKTVDLAPIEARLTALEGKPAPAVVDLSGIEARLAVLEGKPESPAVDLTDILTRLATLEQKPKGKGAK